MVKEYEPISSNLDRLAREVVDGAFKVHCELGPGLLESVNAICLAHELMSRQLVVEPQVQIPIVYKGLRLESGLRLDMFIDRELIVELKAVELMNPLYEAQLLTYLKLAGMRLGLLINFNVPLIKSGIKRLIL